MKTEAAVPLEVRTDDGVTLARLNRPERRNALDHALVLALRDTVESSDRRGDRVLVLTGGDEFFSSGGDVGSMPGPADGIFGPATRLRVIHDLVLAMTRSDVLVVAAVEGYAVGAAWGVALAADLVVAGHDAWFAAPFAARGLTADAGTAFHLPRRLGPHRAARHLYLGERLGAADAHAAGLVSELAPDGSVTARALEIATTLAHGPAQSNALTKSLVTRDHLADLTEFLTAERAAVSLAGHGGDAREGRAAFVDRREPQFS